jgi:hypothetical protein
VLYPLSYEGIDQTRQPRWAAASHQVSGVRPLRTNKKACGAVLPAG